LHYAESLVDGPGKRMVTYAVPIRDDEKVTWREVRDYDTSSRGAFPYEHVIPRGDEAFAVIGRLPLAAGAGVTGQVGDAESHLFAARPLVNFASAGCDSISTAARQQIHRSAERRTVRDHIQGPAWILTKLAVSCPSPPVAPGAPLPGPNGQDAPLSRGSIVFRPRAKSKHNAAST